MASLDLIVLGLAVVALALAIVQLVLASRQMADARQQSQELSQIRSTMSTRFLGQFPDFVPMIVDLVRGAGHSIVICSDCPGYAYVSDHASWREYRVALQERQDLGVTVDLTIQDAAHRRLLDEEQYHHTGPAWELWKGEPANHARLTKILAAHGNTHTVEDLDRPMFLRLLEDVNQQMLRDTFSRASVTEVDSFMPLLFWIVDGRTAIFTFAPISEGVVEYGFTTVDPRLIESFHELGERYRRLKSQR